MKYRHFILTIGLIILLVCIAGCTSSFHTQEELKNQYNPPANKAVPTVTSCEGDLVPGSYHSVKNMGLHDVGTPDNYATLEINGNSAGTLTLPGNVFHMSISKQKYWTCPEGLFTWISENPHNSGDINIVGVNPSKIILYGDLYFDEIDFVRD